MNPLNIKIISIKNVKHKSLTNNFIIIKVCLKTKRVKYNKLSNINVISYLVSKVLANS